MPFPTLSLRTRIPWIIAFIEGFSTLAVEVIAIRLAIPVVGSSIVLTGVILGVVLFALSAGYWRGGSLSAHWDTAKLRRVLARNLLLAALLYGALAFPFEALLLQNFLRWDFGLPLAIGSMAMILFFAPIYLASQTVPMLAELTNFDGKAGKASGKVLFFSTVGSVAGGIVTPVWLFPSIGVHLSTYVVFGVLIVAAAVVALDSYRPPVIAIASLGAMCVLWLPDRMLPQPDNLFAFDSPYQSIRIVETKKSNGRVERAFMMGGGRASGIYTDTGETSILYVQAAEKAWAETRAGEILVIGAAGFTFPRDVAKLPATRRIDAVDVDPAVRHIAERYFLKEQLNPKIQFLPISARYAVKKLFQDSRHYGFTLIDAYYGQGIPDELVTVEFFRDVHLISDHTAVNVILDKDLESDFALNLLATFREAFGAVWVSDVRHGTDELTNILVTSWPIAGSAPWNGEGTAYRDDRNSADRDHVELMW